MDRNNFPNYKDNFFEIHSLERKFITLFLWSIPLVSILMSVSESTEFYTNWEFYSPWAIILLLIFYRRIPPFFYRYLSKLPLIAIILVGLHLFLQNHDLTTYQKVIESILIIFALLAVIPCQKIKRGPV
jgi:hypothetical protein